MHLSHLSAWYNTIGKIKKQSVASANGTVGERGSPMHTPRRVGAPVVFSVEAARELRHWPVAVEALRRRLLVVRFPALLPPPKD